MDLSSLQSLPSETWQVINKAKASLQTNLSAIRDDIISLKNHVTLVGQVDLLMDIVLAAGGMDDLACDLDIENPEDTAKYAKWLNDATNAFGEITNTSVTFFGHLRELSRRIDLQIEVGKIR